MDSHASETFIVLLSDLDPVIRAELTALLPNLVSDQRRKNRLFLLRPVGAITLITLASCLIVQLPLDDLITPGVQMGDVLLAIPVDNLATSIHESVLVSVSSLEFKLIPALVFLSSC